MNIDFDAKQIFIIRDETVTLILKLEQLFNHNPPVFKKYFAWDKNAFIGADTRVRPYKDPTLSKREVMHILSRFGSW